MVRMKRLYCECASSDCADAVGSFKTCKYILETATYYR